MPVGSDRAGGECGPPAGRVATGGAAAGAVGWVDALAAPRGSAPGVGAGAGVAAAEAAAALAEEGAGPAEPAGGASGAERDERCEAVPATGRSTRRRLEARPEGAAGDAAAAPGSEEGWRWAPGTGAGEVAAGMPEVRPEGEEEEVACSPRSPVDIFYDAVVAAGGAAGREVPIRELAEVLRGRGLAEGAVQAAAERWRSHGVMVLGAAPGTEQPGTGSALPGGLPFGLRL